MSKNLAAPKSAAASKVEKTPDYSYLASKEVSSLHLALAAFIEDHGGPEIDPKAIQAVLSAHGTFQKSDYNKNREDYKARTAASIYKGGVTTSKNFEWVVNPETGESELVETEAPKVEEPKEVEAPKTAPKAAPKPKAATTPKTAPKAAPAKTVTRRPRKAVTTATK